MKTDLNEKFSRMTNRQKELLVKEIAETACNLEKTIHGCSRCTFYALQKHLELGGGKDAFKASVPLSAGVVRGMHACGALIGAIMACGIIFASDKPELVHPATPNEVSLRYQLAQDRARWVCDKFKERFGSFDCVEIKSFVTGRSWDFNNPKDREDTFKPEYHEKCGEVTKTAACLAAKAILELP